MAKIGGIRRGIIRSSLWAFAVIAIGGFPPRAHGIDNIRPVFLKLNGYYLLYTRPSSPSVRDGHVMVPLRVTARLMGFAVTMSQEGRVARVSPQRTSTGQVGRRLLLQAGEKTARVDGREFSLATSPQLMRVDSDLLVPVRALTTAFGISPAWDQKHRILSLNDARMMKVDDLDQLEQELQAAAYPDSQSIVPIAFTLERSGVSGGVVRPQMTISFQRIGSDSEGGQPVLFGLARYRSQHNAIITPLNRSVDLPSTKDPCKRSAVRMHCIVVLPSFGSPIDYVVIRVQLRR
jgi:hypothetical protein